MKISINIELKKDKNNKPSSEASKNKNIDPWEEKEKQIKKSCIWLRVLAVAICTFVILILAAIQTLLAMVGAYGGIMALIIWVPGIIGVKYVWRLYSQMIFEKRYDISSLDVPNPTVGTLVVNKAQYELEELLWRTYQRYQDIGEEALKERMKKLSNLADEALDEISVIEKRVFLFIGADPQNRSYTSKDEFIGDFKNFEGDT